MRHEEETSMCCYIENCHCRCSRKPSQYAEKLALVQGLWKFEICKLTPP
jgi:hypothetical protein